MIIVDDVKSAIDVMLHPGEQTKQPMSIKDGILRYIRTVFGSVIILTFVMILFGSIIISILNLFLPQAGHILALYGAFAVVLIWLAFFVLYPLILLIIAAIVHVVGKAIGGFGNSFSNTFSAIIYDVLVSAPFIWLYLIPILGQVISFVLGIWSIIVVVIALSNQQSISRLKAFLVLIATAIIISIVSFIGLLGAASLFGGLHTNYNVNYTISSAPTTINYNSTSGAGTTSISSFSSAGTLECTPAGSQFNCTTNVADNVSTSPLYFFKNGNTTILNGTSIAFWISQDTGQTWYNLNVTYVPSGTPLNSTGVPMPFNTIYATAWPSMSSQSSSISLLVVNMPVSRNTTGTFNGSIWARYSLSSSSSQWQYAKLADVSVTVT